MIESLLTKLQGLRPATLLKKTPRQVFSSEYCEIFRNTFFYRTPPAFLTMKCWLQILIDMILNFQ